MLYTSTYATNSITNGQLKFPKRFAETFHSLNEGNKEVLLLPINEGLESCLLVLDSRYMDLLEQRDPVDPVYRDERRLIASCGVGSHVLDQNLYVPEKLLAAVGIKDQAVIQGALSYFELWAPQNFREYIYKGRLAASARYFGI